MELRHLELLRKLADRGTVTAVADATYRPPSAVSQQLRSAERAFGTRLVEPTAISSGSPRQVGCSPRGQST